MRSDDDLKRCTAPSSGAANYIDPELVAAGLSRQQFAKLQTCTTQKETPNRRISYLI